jgi:hypothetical protein
VAVKRENRGPGRSKTRKSELRGLLAQAAKDLDEGGLEFLLNQANVLVYNMQVERLNDRTRKARDAGRGPGKRDKAGARKAGAGMSGAGEVEIVEKEESGNFFIVVNNFRILFTREEMRSLVKICHAASDERDAGSRLFSWFERNRKDVLIDGGIVSRTHPALQAVHSILVSRYRVKGGG